MSVARTIFNYVAPVAFATAMFATPTFAQQQKTETKTPVAQKFSKTAAANDDVKPGVYVADFRTPNNPKALTDVRSAIEASKGGKFVLLLGLKPNDELSTKIFQAVSSRAHVMQKTEDGFKDKAILVAKGNFDKDFGNQIGVYYGGKVYFTIKDPSGDTETESVLFEALQKTLAASQKKPDSKPAAVPVISRQP